jgi:hypothetical protein
MEEAGIIVGYHAVEERPLRLAQGKLFRAIQFNLRNQELGGCVKTQVISPGRAAWRLPGA